MKERLGLALVLAAAMSALAACGTPPDAAAPVSPRSSDAGLLEDEAPVGKVTVAVVDAGRADANAASSTR